MKIVPKEIFQDMCKSMMHVYLPLAASHLSCELPGSYFLIVPIPA